MKQKVNLLNAIIDESMKQFFSKGYKSLNIDELVKDIGISKATFYKYIPSKEFLFEECIRRHLDIFKKEINGNIKKILKSNKETFFKFFIELIKKSSDFLTSISGVINLQVEKRFPHISLKLKEFTKKQIENSFFSIIQKGREIGLIKSQINDEILFFIIFTTLTNIKQFIETHRSEITLSKFFYEYFSILFNGILLEESKSIFYKQFNILIYEKGNF
ncbi:MAG: TetR/AcrR family transcriptional regulator [Ignavibacteria bacterium]|nr:TetR/AcrR family transcriptional regulator [Ignavibacteria bacterium]